MTGALIEIASVLAIISLRASLKHTSHISLPEMDGLDTNVACPHALEKALLRSDTSRAADSVNASCSLPSSGDVLLGLER